MLIGSTPSRSGSPSFFATFRTIVGVRSLWNPLSPPCGRVCGVMPSASSCPSIVWNSFRTPTSSAMTASMFMASPPYVRLSYQA